MPTTLYTLNLRIILALQSPSNVTGSINTGRLIPQTMYYFYSFAEFRSGNMDEQVVFSVPSGGIGDLCGNLIVTNMGLPVKKFVVATNENDEYPKFVKSFL